MTIKQFDFGAATISYALMRSDRKTLGITVSPEQSVVVKAPLHAKQQRIDAVLLSKAPWILQQLAHFASFEYTFPPRRYFNGETQLYLGRQYQLRVIKGAVNSVRFNGRFMEVTTRPKAETAQVLKQWYRERAKLKFDAIAQPCIERFERYGVRPSNLYIQQMNKRWGSCTPSGKIILHPDLLQAPAACIEYVIVHELCHLVHRSHTRAFFALQQRMMPDWEKWKVRLEKLLG